MNHRDHEYHPRRFYRDSEQSVILGVCAGIAEHFDWPLWLTRIGVLGLGWFFTIPVIVAYFVAALVLPERPLRYCGEHDERAFWQSRNRRS